MRNHPELDQTAMRRFAEDGFLVVEDAIPRDELDLWRVRVLDLLARREEIAGDWDWRQGEPVKGRAFRIVQAGVAAHFPEVVRAPFRLWMAAAASRLMHQPMEFWYDQFLAKPPGTGAATPWHQDEAYWGRKHADAAITCWMAFHDVDPTDGCMHFVRGGHRQGVLDHRNPPEMASDLLVCGIADGDVVPCPLRAGSVTFHHAKTPHMTPANRSDHWRLSVTAHFCAAGRQGEGDHYPWRRHVDQGQALREAAAGG